ncbi:MAG: alkaline phosphatase family protein [Nannocystaceae bacterium]
MGADSEIDHDPSVAAVHGAKVGATSGAADDDMDENDTPSPADDPTDEEDNPDDTPDPSDDDATDATDATDSDDSVTIEPGDTTFPGESSSDGTNHPPQADAGLALVAHQGKATLRGSDSFDVDGDPLTFHWSLIRGPAPAVLSDQNAAFTTLTLSEPGHYLFRLTVGDGQATDTSEVLVLSPVPSDPPDDAQPFEFVIHISVDGMRPDIVPLLGPALLPALHRLRDEGAFTDNARTALTQTVTVPNHTCELTGRMIAGPNGHGYYMNYSIDGTTLHSNKGSYVASVFDVVHDAGRRTAFFGGKTKMKVLHLSYNGQHGAEDLTGANNGRAKIDRIFIDFNLDTLISGVVQDLRRTPYEYTFIHVATPDNAGHVSGWAVEAGSNYADAMIETDAAIGRILELVETTTVLRGRTLLVLTADHGGFGFGHENTTQLENYAVPIYVWGSGVRPGADLYTLNSGVRRDPGTQNPDQADTLPPIRNGEAANLACQALGLPNVPGSTLNVALPLKLH